MRRMHLTLKTETTRPASANVLQQQARFDALVDRYNTERPASSDRHADPLVVVYAITAALRGLEELDSRSHRARRFEARRGRTGAMR